MRAEEEKREKGKRRDKKRKKEEAIEIKIVFFICAVVIFRIYQRTNGPVNAHLISEQITH